MPSYHRGEGSFGADLNAVRAAFGLTAIPFEGPIDIDYLGDIPNASVAREALTFMRDQNNEIELHKRHVPEDVERAWRVVLRGCIAHGVVIPYDLRGFARRLGLVVPG